MDRRLYILTSPEKRKAVANIVAQLTRGFRVEIKGPKRTLPQNDLMWAWLTAYEEQATWGGEKLSARDWKDMFSGALKAARKGLRIVPGLEGGIMILGLSTSDMSVAEMSELIDYMGSKAVEFGVQFHDGQGAREGQEPSARAA